MSKYSFDRIGSGDFESMAKALLESTYRVGGKLIQFGDGKDGGREATWTQPPGHPTYRRPANEKEDVPKEWVFQVKYHDIAQRGWVGARDAVLGDLEKELTKIVRKHKVPCHAYVMITNVPFTGARNIGTRDKVATLAKKWQQQIPEIQVWDAADLSRMLDADEAVRTAYLDQILPGDVLKAIYQGVTFQADRRESAFRAYLQYVVERDAAARAEEAGDEPGLALAEVFVDLKLKLVKDTPHESVRNVIRDWLERDGPSEEPSAAFLPSDFDQVPASFALLLGDYPSLLLLGGPGLGKSTLAQFVVLYHAARAVDPDLAAHLSSRAKLTGALKAEDLDACCTPKFPFRVELRRYARWLAEQQRNGTRGELARYVAEVLVNANVSGNLNMDDVFALAASDRILLVLDGLDEVPNPETRKQILENLEIFLRRAAAEGGTVEVVLSSRPRGYAGEFEGFQPLAWDMNELDPDDFDDYCERWLRQRIRDAEERREARDRIERGMKSEAVRRLAGSLLQATVMLTLVRRKAEIPHERHNLYAKYVEVIFDREKEKWPVVREHSAELMRLHERVGYEVHRKMERRDVVALDREAFRDYVVRVLEDYSAADLGERRLREVADDIITAATDRLCFMAGKGKEQADIDFILQSFREYFAARYLFNHPDGDADRTFSTLVVRGPYWANVLQFYVAQASANQQLRWVLSAEGADFDATSAAQLVDLTRRRRSLLNVLPEFTVQRKADFERTLRIIFGAETRWTWIDQDYAAEILRVLRSGAAQTLLRDIFGELSSEDEATLAAEVTLLNGLARARSKESSRLARVVQHLLKADRTRPVAIRAAVENDLEVDLSQCDLSAVAVDRLLYQRRLRGPLRSLLRCQNKEKQCEMLLFWPSFLQEAPLQERIVRNVLPRRNITLTSGSVEAYLLPYLVRGHLDAEEVNSLSCELQNVPSSCARYLDLLLQAALHPTSTKHDNEARRLEREVEATYKANVVWDADTLLGPPVSRFSSREEWRDFKAQVSELASADEGWIQHSVDLAPCPGVWAALCFHPEHWPWLVEEGVLSNEESQQLSSSRLARILAMPSIPPRFFEHWAIHGRIQPAPRIDKIVGVALNVAENHGVHRLSQDRRLVGFLAHVGDQRVDKALADQLLQRAINLPALPRCWAGLLLNISLLLEKVDVDLLLKFWERIQSCKPYAVPLFTHGERPMTGHDALMESLLVSQRSTALALAAALAGAAHLERRTEDRLRNRLIAAITDDSATTETRTRFLQALLSLRIGLDEFAIWEQPRMVFSLIDEKAWGLEAICGRLREAMEPGSNLPRDELRDRLASFVTRHHEYPAELGSAALEGILKLEVAAAHPLADDDWQHHA